MHSKSYTSACCFYCFNGNNNNQFGPSEGEPGKQWWCVEEEGCPSCRTPRTRLFSSLSEQPDGASAYWLPARQAPGLRYHLHAAVQPRAEQTLLRLRQSGPGDALLSLPGQWVSSTLSFTLPGPPCLPAHCPHPSSALPLGPFISPPSPLSFLLPASTPPTPQSSTHSS